MTGEFQRIAPSELDDLQERLREDSNAVEHYLDHDVRRFDPPDLHLDIDKAWAGLHFLFNRDPFEIISLEGSLVFGGQPIGADSGYGPALVLSLDEVKEISEALAKVTEDWFRSRFDATAFAQTKIYPDGDWADPEVLPWLWTTFCDVRQFFQDAAYFSDAMRFFSISPDAKFNSPACNL